MGDSLEALDRQYEAFDWEYALASKILTKTAKIGVLGVGYVGLPLAVRFASAGYKTVGLDINQDRVDSINRGKSHITDVRNEMIREVIRSGRLSATSDFGLLGALDIVCVCVPTPFNSISKDPDLSYIRSGITAIAQHLHHGMMIILESTTYPGTTEEVVLPAFEATGLKVGRDVFLVFSPERIDPGNQVFHVHNTPRVVGGVTAKCANLARLLYPQIVNVGSVHEVSSPTVAEMVKLFENTFRAVNIALVNEFAMLCQRMNLDVWEIIDAASTKPFGFMPFSPGPGVGGHCIPVDPYYLMWKARQYGFDTRFIDLAARINESMPTYVVERLSSLLQQRGKPIEGSRILVVGAAFKRNVNDCRNSPAVKVMEILASQGAELTYSDPFVPRIELNGTINLMMESIEITDSVVADTDCVLVLVDHTDFDWSLISSRAPLVFDTRNALRDYSTANIVKL